MIVFDLDGTLYDTSPVWDFFRDAVSRRMSATGGMQFARDLERLIPERSDRSWWEIIVHAAMPYVPVDYDWWEPFLAAEAFLLSEACAVGASPAFHDFCRGSASRVDLALVTNSPWKRALPLLAKLDILRYFHYIRADAKKPENLVFWVSKWRPELKGYQIASVGDSYQSDIQPGWVQGWYSVHVTRGGLSYHPCHASGALDDVLEDLYQWVYS